MIHFAGRKAVGESVEFPMLYYTHNVSGTVNLIEAMRKHNVKQVSLCFCALHDVARLPVLPANLLLADHVELTGHMIMPAGSSDVMFVCCRWSSQVPVQFMATLPRFLLMRHTHSVLPAHMDAAS